MSQQKSKTIQCSLLTYISSIPKEKPTNNQIENTTDEPSIDVQVPNSIDNESGADANADTIQKNIRNTAPSDLGIDSPAQPICNYPKTNYNGVNRSFRKEWYFLYVWLEYSKEADAVYCFCCRIYLCHAGASSRDVERAFTLSGYNNWKHALEPGIGFNKHELCQSHIRAMCAWNEHKKRASTESSIGIL